MEYKLRLELRSRTYDHIGGFRYTIALESCVRAGSWWERSLERWKNWNAHMRGVKHMIILED